MMMNINEKSNQRGTLLVEALAMLGLIAMVTPTLYKKSAERMQEIQDINIASQARTMNSVIETMMKANVTNLLAATSSSSNATVIIPYEDDSSCTHCFNKGYSSYIPFGYNVGDLKNYKFPTVFIHNDNSSLTSYIVYPKEANIGRKRAAKVASLVGANGGMVWEEDTSIQGTGDAWALDSDMISNLNMDDAELTENSLVVTSVEPITVDNQDNEKYLYRVPPEDNDATKYYHNMMVTDLYMGGLHDENDLYADQAQQFHSIYNVRKLMLNSQCTRANIGENSAAADCDPSIADLYIGRPVGNYTTPDGNSIGSGTNNGAAWIYGNLKALNNRFRLSNTYNAALERTGSDVMEFVRMTDDSSSVNMYVLRADNSSGAAYVGMLDNFVLAREDSSSNAEFIVGSSGVGGAEGAFIHALVHNGQNTLRLNSPDTGGNDSSITQINRYGGTVYINGGSTTANTYINDGGGLLVAGKDGQWINASEKDGNAKLELLNGNNTSGLDNREFVVGSSSMADSMFYGNSSKVTLRDGLIRVYSHATSHDADNVGGLNLPPYSSDTDITTNSGAALITTKYTDILSNTYITDKGRYAMSSDIGGETFKRGNFALGIAGSAWVDDDLLARRAWFDKAGMKNLHAGFSSIAQFRAHPDKAWLNVYGDDTTGGVYIRNPLKTGEAPTDSSSALFWADSTGVDFKDFEGAYGYVRDGIARLGWQKIGDASMNNRISADSSRVDIYGYKDVYINSNSSAAASSHVAIQNHALELYKQPVLTGSGTDLGNRIEMRAGDFGLWTKYGEGNASSAAQLYANDEKIRIRTVDFEVQEKVHSTAVFKVMPDLTSVGSSDANVLMDGTVHITGNDVIHVASNLRNRAATGTGVDSSHAMFEVDPNYIQVMGIDDSSATYTTNPLFRVGAKDIYGTSSVVANSGNASVYIRRGAIELEHSNTAMADSSADNGVGYIKADRLVSGSGIRINQNTANAQDSYDQFMVNPAYTSVMHDIKLTSRGGARLSDVLPDYILKNVYNISNNCVEGETATTCTEPGMNAWAQPYVGTIPYPLCPPGYRELATIVPISFMMAQAGELHQANRGNSYWEVQQGRQAAILANSNELLYPNFYEEKSAVINDIVENPSTHTGWEMRMQEKINGWSFGFQATHPSTSSLIPNDKVNAHDSSKSGQDPANYWVYLSNKNAATTTGKPIPMPLYFQQNTWLKTSLEPDESNKQWKAYLGFIYDKSVWGDTLKGHTGTTAPVKSNNTNTNGDATLADLAGNFVWNLFPVPINTLEGHATVYCHFQRNQFTSWSDTSGRRLVDQLNLLGGTTEDDKTRSTVGLNDPSLKYSDPW